MNDMSPRGEITILPHRMPRRATANRSVPDRLVEAITDREFIAVAGFCAIGLLLTASFFRSFASFGDGAAALALMP